jgi:hypothetical protein
MVWAVVSDGPSAIGVLTRQIEAEVQSLAVILGVGEGEPLDAPLCTIELACLRIRQLARMGL